MSFAVFVRYTCVLLLYPTRMHTIWVGMSYNNASEAWNPSKARTRSEVNATGIKLAAFVRPMIEIDEADKEILT